MSGVRFQAGSRVFTPNTRYLEPMLGEGFITPDNVQKKSYFHTKILSLNLRLIPFWDTKRVIRDNVATINPQSYRLLIHIDADFHLSTNVVAAQTATTRRSTLGVSLVLPTPNREIGETDDGYS